MDKFFTVDDIAKMTSFTTRTIRNYLKDGLLTGRKIGGQWRFTQEDFINFINQGNISAMMVSENKQTVLDFVEGVYSDYTGEIQTCTIVDIYRPAAEVAELRDKLMVTLSLDAEKNNTSGFMKFSYEYEEAEGKGRFTLFGSPAYIAAAMKILQEATQ